MSHDPFYTLIFGADYEEPSYIEFISCPENIISYLEKSRYEYCIIVYPDCTIERYYKITNALGPDCWKKDDENPPTLHAPTYIFLS